jgi:hypothetical protein
MVKVEGGRLVGLTAGDAEVLSGAEGEQYRASLTKPRGRSLSQLNLWWGVCKLIAENYETEFLQVTPQFVSDTLKVGSGHYSVTILADGTYRLQPLSISFNKLGQDEFNTLMDKAMQVASVKFGPGLAEAARAEMERALSGKGRADEA